MAQMLYGIRAKDVLFVPPDMMRVLSKFPPFMAGRTPSSTPGHPPSDFIGLANERLIALLALATAIVGLSLLAFGVLLPSRAIVCDRPLCLSLIVCIRKIYRPFGLSPSITDAPLVGIPLPKILPDLVYWQSILQVLTSLQLCYPGLAYRRPISVEVEVL